VGFHIYLLKFYECQDFKVYFNLWSGGGANWQQELANFEKEEQDSWVSVHREKNLKPSFADVVKKVELTGANSTNIRNPQWQSKLGTSAPNRISVKLTGANSTNIRNPQWQSKLRTSAPNRISVFDRIKRSEVSHPARPRISVFYRLGPGQGNRGSSIAKNKAHSASNQWTRNRSHSKQVASQETYRSWTYDADKSRFRFLNSAPSKSASYVKCVRCLMEGHTKWVCQGPIRCHNCNKPGHIAIQCWQNKTNSKAKFQQSSVNSVWVPKQIPGTERNTKGQKSRMEGKGPAPAPPCPPSSPPLLLSSAAPPSTLLNLADPFVREARHSLQQASPQREILQQDLIGHLPGDEDPMPTNVHNVHFDFFGLMQEVQTLGDHAENHEHSDQQQADADSGEKWGDLLPLNNDQLEQLQQNADQAVNYDLLDLNLLPEMPVP
jgi:hypothetical protein